MTAPAPPGLSRRDYALLALFALALFSIKPLFGRPLTGHESVQPQTSREMFHGGDWLVPTVGGTPWLERPPVPMWLICAVYAVAGDADSDAVARFAAVLAAVPIVLLVAGVGSHLFGRGAGLAAALIYATMQEVYAYSSNPEADIFLALIVTAVLAVFVRLEFGPRAERAGEPRGFFARRPWLVAAFFALLGATNLAKGMFFGTVMAALPVAGYLLWNRSWDQIRRYVWLWGWLLAAAVALAWPAAVIGQHPEILELWRQHYLGRLHQGYLAEPWWYYGAMVPYVLLPWTVPAFLGLWATRRAALAGPGPERFLWCWAVLPPLVFSLSDGKHHHYLLQCIAPWAVLSVIGAVRVWTFCRERLPGWARRPVLTAVVCGVVVGGAIAVFGDRVPGGAPVLVAVGVFVPVAVFVAVRAVLSQNPARALAGVVLVVTAVYAAWAPYQANYLDEYRHDAALLREAGELVPPDHPLFVEYDWYSPLETFWVLYHTSRPGVVVRDGWQVAEQSAGRKTAYVLARRADVPLLSGVGRVEPVRESRWTRREQSPDERRVLYKITFRRNIPPLPESMLARTRGPLW